MSDSNQIRINELARELEIKAKVLIDYLPEIGVAEKKTHSSSLDLDHAELVRKHFHAVATEEAKKGVKPAPRPAAPAAAPRPTVAAPATVPARPPVPGAPSAVRPVAPPSAGTTVTPPSGSQTAPNRQAAPPAQPAAPT